MAVVGIASGVGVGTVLEEVAVLDKLSSSFAGEVVGLGVILTTGLASTSLARLLVFWYWEAR